MYKRQIIERLEEVEKEDIQAEYARAGSLRNALSGISHFAYAQLLDDTHIIRAIFTHFRNYPREDKNDWLDLRRRASQTIIEVVRVYKNEVRRHDIDRAADMLVYFYNTIFLERILIADPALLDKPPLDAYELIEEITDFAYGYLTMPKTKRPD